MIKNLEATMYTAVSPGPTPQARPSPSKTSKVAPRPPASASPAEAAC
jgi:hypothetical protein